MNRALPDRSLMISYAEGLRFAQIVLRSFNHGKLKPWALSRQPPVRYTLLVSLKNNNVAKPLPNFVQRLLAEFGYLTTVVLDHDAPGGRHLFLFADSKQLTAFRREMPPSEALLSSPMAS